MNIYEVEQKTSPFPVGNKVKLDIQELKIGAIQSDSVEENGVVLAVGPEGKHQEWVGRRLCFKAWAVDVISIGDTKHYFISEDSDAICAIE